MDKFEYHRLIDDLGLNEYICFTHVISMLGQVCPLPGIEFCSVFKTDCGTFHDKVQLPASFCLFPTTLLIQGPTSAEI